ncbi:MAG TPA: beta-ketoacyl synthase N-terminal-like domain-containing protein [Polyangiaceae bacterium]
MLDSAVFITGGCVILPRANAERTWASIDMDPESVLGPERCRRLDPLSQLALVAIERARERAELKRERGRAVAQDEGIVVGSALAATVTTVRYARRLVSVGPATTNPIDFPDSIDGAPAAHVALDLGLGGVSLTLSDGNRSAVRALIHAARLVAWNRVKRMYVVVGDRCDPFFAEAIVRGGLLLKRDYPVSVQEQPPYPRCWAECVLSLVLAGRSTAQRFTSGADAIELLGHLPESDLPPIVAASAADLARDGAALSWTAEPLATARLTPTGGGATLVDPSGALDLAAAWLKVAGAKSCVIGATEPEVATPFAVHARCGRDPYPNLRFVRRPGQ